MSSMHAKLFTANGKFWLQDVGSTNRTWLRISAEGEKSEDTPVVVGDVIKIGSTVLVVHYPDLSRFSVPLPIDAEKEPSNPPAEENACKICFSRESNAAFYPCGHMICDSCATKCQKCPVCRSTIREIVKLYR
mmetsp:Transcript_18316/g.2971  ORF Transcript_18316/g.2971 Transcript_18316/m.2971 type:complete len:133 (+) Transcript_18316:781-1179(+)